MSRPHSSVNYVEPNITSTRREYSGKSFVEWASNGDDFQRAPRLEDYSIMVNLEVEVCPRVNISKDERTQKDVLIMSFKTVTNGSGSTVNFMGGTKINCNDKNNNTINFLTTNYANMYVGDLINYGTTEMIGIKSIDIEYQKSCVPIINIKFTDVRGLSLFQPTELSRTNAYQGIGGINADNVAQSFFQCFFRVPMPKFTITIKGFYGRPVTYEVMCDKFETSFNSATGDYDIDTRFIGYSYSFLTDIVMDALMAAPYSDYGGREGLYNKYWVSQINSDRFKIWNKEKTVRNNIPTLYEVFRNVKQVVKETTEINSVIDEEANTHENEITDLNALKDIYTLWYSTLFNILTNRFGKEYCYLFTEDGCHYRILVLANNKTKDLLSLYPEYNNFPDEFKDIHKNLISAINEYNSKNTSFKKLDNISEDFSDYKRCNLFNPLFINASNEIVFNGFSKKNTLPETDVFKHVFKGVSFSGENASVEADEYKKHVLSTIYNDGADQYIDCYAVNVDYSGIDLRIKALQADANRNPEDKMNERKTKELNKVLYEKLGFFPSVENFSRMMMAHLETLMRQMYDCVNKCEGRKASDLGVNPSENIDVGQMNVGKDPVIPPFPRVYRDTEGEDGINKREDTWVGEYTGGTQVFEEVNFINGLFNGAEKVMTLFKDFQETQKEEAREVLVQASPTPIVKHPLTSFDFYINKPPYGTSSEIANDDTGLGLMGRIAMRMFNILCLNHFREEFGTSFFGTKNTELVGKIEADNFYQTSKITNDKIITMLRNGVFESEKILSAITTTNLQDAPWGEKSLFTNSNNLWLDCYRVSKGSTSAYTNNVYPIQNINYGNLKTAFANINQLKITDSDGDISIWNIPASITNAQVIGSSECGYGTTLILDNVNAIEEQLRSSNSSADSGYTDIYNTISSACSFDNAVKNGYSTFGVVQGTHSISKKVPFSNAENPTSAKIDGDNAVLVVGDKPYPHPNIEKLDDRESKMGAFNNTVITEVFGILKQAATGLYGVDTNSSIYDNHYNNAPNPLTSRGNVDGVTLTDRQCRAAQALFGVLMNTKAIGTYLNSNKNTVIYLPKIAVLQIGALIFASGGIHGHLTEEYKSSIKLEMCKYLPLLNYPQEMLDYISSLSKVAKYQYEKYFIKWIKDNGEKFLKGLISASNVLSTFEGTQSSKRKVLNQNKEFVQEITNELLRAVCIVKLSVNHKKKSRSSYPLSRGLAKTYLDAFIDRLKQLYHIDYAEDENGNLVKTTDEPNKTTPDMKKELYRYLKQVYDKWIPMSSFENWQLEAFFNDKKGGEGRGHKFYFIDSYYNDISDKLIINPLTVAEKVNALLESADINSMLLGFMADMYSANKSMLMVLQNFADLRKKDAMDELFTPIPFNAISWDDINKDPSFVIVYPYQASRNLNIPDGEYEDDGFMLNDEFETPRAIRSKVNEENGHYKIPAFGVTYGGQYQSYFKKVNIDMKSPVATEQSIKAKHALLRASSSKGEKGIVSQDLYDVYASQSYTCNVEMMGCPWIQPLMYFVLLNVPMFRGSYMIMKVKHIIKPGDMTTTFTGCRMANVANSLVEDIFTDGGIDNANTKYTEFESEKQMKADVDNDCPYKVYPLWESNALGGTWEGDEKGPTFSSRKAWATALYHGWMSHGASSELAKVIVAQEALESGWGESGCAKKFNYGGVLTSGGSCRAFNSLDEFIQYKIDKSLNKYFPGALQAKTAHQYFVILQNVKSNGDTGNTTGAMYCTSKDCVGEKYEKSIMGTNGRGGTYGTVCGLLKDVSSTPTKSSSVETNDKKDDIKTAFFNAINKSAQDTPSIARKLKREDRPNDYIRITQEGDKNDKLGIVFDMILNSEYYNYIQELGWVYQNGGLQSDVPPTSIYCKLAQSPDISKKGVWATEVKKSTGIRTSPEIPTEEGQNNPTLLKSLAKRRAAVGNDANFNKEVQQLKNVKGLDKYKPQDCNTLVSTGGGSGGGNNMNPSEISPNDAGTIDGWDVGKACAWIISHDQGCRKVGSKTKCGISKCASYVEDAIAAGGGPLKNRMHCGDKPTPGGPATNLRYGGILEKNGFVQIDSGTVASRGNPTISLQAGDVAILGPKSGGKFHACLYTASRGWCSDFIQNNMNVYGSSQPYAIYRFHNKKKS